jgi:hypothetical protein
MLEKFLPQFKILDGIHADSGELCLKKIQDVWLESWRKDGLGGTHILAYTIPYTKMGLAVLEWATTVLVLLMVLHVGLLESVAEPNTNLDILSSKVNAFQKND